MTGLEQCVVAGAQVGCPLDQMLNFLSTGVFFNPGRKTRRRRARGRRVGRSGRRTITGRGASPSRLPGLKNHARRKKVQHLIQRTPTCAPATTHCSRPVISQAAPEPKVHQWNRDHSTRPCAYPTRTCLNEALRNPQRLYRKRLLASKIRWVWNLPSSDFD